MRNVIIVTVVVFLIYAVLGWFAGGWIGLEGMKLWILRGALWLLGLIAAGAVIWFFWNKKKQEEAAEYEESPETDDIGLLVKEAESRLAAARGKGGQLGDLTAIFVIGETGAAKTSTIVHCGLDPELLAGQVYRDKDLIPTRAANLWYAHGAVLVEAAGKIVNETSGWSKLARRLQPGRLKAAVGGGAAAPRAALVMVEGEALARPGAPEALAATARTLRSRLGEVSQELGINLPVYVMFTKMDRIPFFAEYVRNLNNEEAMQVLGVTVPMLADRKGVWAENETARLTGVYEQLFRSLANARPMLLARESDPSKLGGVYEFPREFRKLRANMVQFLVDLCRPSQLTVGPFLRGFYFSGVRPVVVNEAAPAAPQSVRGGDHGATGIFHMESAAQAAAPRAVARRVPQWVFVTALFHKVILADRGALGASGASTKTSFMRRFLLATAAVLCLLYSIALVVSFAKNRALESDVRDAAHGIESVQADSSRVASVTSLRALERLRQSLATLTSYKRDGAPTSYRWGLYAGDAMYPFVRRLYFESFRRTMFEQTQAGLVKTMDTLPAVYGPGAPEFNPTYDTLKAYLITTSNPDKSTRQFLSPVLLNKWSEGRNVDSESRELAQKQFDFYSEELRLENPFSSDAFMPPVEKARKYLNQFGNIARIYAEMLAAASKANPAINFNKQFPGSADTVVEAYEVPGAFSKGGWDFMAAAIKNPEKYFGGEAWVMGTGNKPVGEDAATLSAKLAEMYHADFLKQWRTYMAKATVVKFANVQDAATKLNVLSGNQSTLLSLFWLAAQNTQTDVAEVSSVMQPVHAVVPPKSDTPVADPNKPYANALFGLALSVQAAAGAQQITDALAGPTLESARQAHVVTRQIALGFKADRDGHIETLAQNLLEAPITYVEAIFKGAGPAELNAKGKDMCGQLRKLLAKYPFNSNPKAPDATIGDVNAIFHKPDGALWTFYDTSLQKYLQKDKQSGQYVSVPTATLTLNPVFVSYFNEVAAFAELLYAGNSPDPHISYKLKPVPAEWVQRLELELDGQKMSVSGKDSNPVAFNWQGPGAHGAIGTVKAQGGLELPWTRQSGLWAAWRFFSEAEMQPAGKGLYNLAWKLRLNDQISPNAVKVDLDMGDAPAFFQKGYFSKLGCPAGDVAK